MGDPKDAPKTRVGGKDRSPSPDDTVAAAEAVEEEATGQTVNAKTGELVSAEDVPKLIEERDKETEEASKQAQQSAEDNAT
jgi:hypothetical protein